MVACQCEVGAGLCEAGVDCGARREGRMHCSRDRRLGRSQKRNRCEGRFHFPLAPAPGPFLFPHSPSLSVFLSLSLSCSLSLARSLSFSLSMCVGAHVRACRHTCRFQRPSSPCGLTPPPCRSSGHCSPRAAAEPHCRHPHVVCSHQSMRPACPCAREQQ